MKKAEGTGWGKLYIAGEYAVIHPGHPAVILATQRNIRATIETSDRFHLVSVNNRREIVFDDFDMMDDYWKYALCAISVFYQFLEEKEVDFFPVSISLKSDLDSDDGRKLGLGSSGAVVASIFKGLNQYYEQHLDHLSLFKLCVISQNRLRIGGSYGDLAAAVFGGVIRYTRFADFDIEGSIFRLLQMDWPKLSIEYLDFPFKLNLVVGWTGEPISTQLQIDAVSRFYHDPMYLQWLSQSEKIVDDLVQSKSSDTFLEGIRRYRIWLKKLEEMTHLTIETPLIQAFIDICSSRGGAAKSSGAGGGDCAIAFFSHPVSISDILLSKGIMPLTITIAKREVV